MIYRKCKFSRTSICRIIKDNINDGEGDMKFADIEQRAEENKKARADKILAPFVGKFILKKSEDAIISNRQLDKNSDISSNKNIEKKNIEMSNKKNFAEKPEKPEKDLNYYNGEHDLIKEVNNNNNNKEENDINNNDKKDSK